MERESLHQNAANVGSYFLEQLKTLKEKYATIGDVRGKGLMLAIEFVKDRKTKEPFAPSDPYPVLIAKHCRDHGVMVRNQAHRIILSPALTFNTSEVDEAISALDLSLQEES